MIKPGEIDPLNMAGSITYQCNECNDIGEIPVPRFSIENWEEKYEGSPISCPKCGLDLAIK